VELRLGALRRCGGVFDQARRQLDLEVADVAVGYRHTRFAWQFCPEVEVDFGSQQRGMGARSLVWGAAFAKWGRGEAFFAWEKAEVSLGCRGGKAKQRQGKRSAWGSSANHFFPPCP
jgi:hypothetical protein